jgi:hypothetical protein
MFGLRKKQPVRSWTGEQWFVVGRGLDRGYDWESVQMLGGERRESDLNWFAGFLSGVSLARDENLLSKHTFEEAVDWLDTLCRINRNKQICYSATQVVAKLIWPEVDLPIASRR